MHEPNDGPLPPTPEPSPEGTPPPSSTERRTHRSLHDQREHWASVRRWMSRHDLDEFHTLLDALARSVFGEDASVVPHLRRVGKTRVLVFVVDAAHPEASTAYESFLPLERAFWTAYGTIPKPAAAFAVAVRPARGWVRAEALMPLFAHMQGSEELS